MYQVDVKNVHHIKEHRIIIKFVVRISALAIKLSIIMDNARLAHLELSQIYQRPTVLAYHKDVQKDKF